MADVDIGGRSSILPFGSTFQLKHSLSRVPKRYPMQWCMAYSLFKHGCSRHTLRDRIDVDEVEEHVYIRITMIVIVIFVLLARSWTASCS